MELLESIFTDFFVAQDVFGSYEADSQFLIFGKFDVCFDFLA